MMQLKISKSIFIFATLFCATLQAQLPSNFKKCKADKSTINQCVKEAIEDALPKLKDGIPELGLPPIDPLTVPKVTIAEGVTSPVTFDQNYRNFKIYNMSSIAVKSTDVQFDEDKLSITFESEANEIIFDSDYEINGRILLFPIFGNGRCIIRFKNLKFRMFLDTESFVKGGTKYIKVSNASVSTSTEKLFINLDNLFNGKNPKLSDAINLILNDNWQIIYADLARSYEELIEIVFTDYINRIFKKVPYKYLYAV